MEAWMARLPDDLLLKDLRTIPGSHNSCTAKGLAFADRLMWGWAQCQCHSLDEQLAMGVRAFDLRLADDVQGDEIFVTHRLVSNLTLAAACPGIVPY
jgi:hypothetical protein